jgi:hypothetical protein
MLTNYLTALLTAVMSMMVLMACWLAVQRLWQRFFPERSGSDGDALANSGGCRGCNCKSGASEFSHCGRDGIAPDQTTTEVTYHAP